MLEERTREAEEAARARAREIVGDARATRERVLAELTERRQSLERQINDLRAGRTLMVETYQTVERALAQATRVITEEAALPSVAPVPPAPPPDVSARVEAPAITPPVEAPASESPTLGSPAPESTSDDAESPDVHALFERLRSARGHDDADEAGGTETGGTETGGTETGGTETGGAETGETAADDRAAVPVAALASAVDAPAPGQADRDATGGDAADEIGDEARALARRDEDTAEPRGDLLRRAKRALQDEQNDQLDTLRRHRGRLDPAQVLPTLDEQLSRWAHVLQPMVDRIYAAGAATTSETSHPTAPRGLLTELATSLVVPLRDRLSASFASVDVTTPADLEIVLAQRIGARYREWRAQDFEPAVEDAVATAYSRGAYDAAPEGSRLRWVPSRAGACPDCDDNALEATQKGDAFPTGQPHPPAHPGCRCLVVIA
jgi:hypothetical protein